MGSLFLPCLILLCAYLSVSASLRGKDTFTVPYCAGGAPARISSAISAARARAVCM